jgi:hypothetical protein
MTISIGPIRFLRSASRNSATVFASTPALRAVRDAPRAVVLAALRAFCWRPRACPPFLAAARRFADDAPERDDDEVLRPDEPARLRDAPEEERLLDDRELEPDLLLRLPDERLDALDFFAPPLDLPLLFRSAIWFPLRCRQPLGDSFPRMRDYLTS